MIRLTDADYAAAAAELGCTVAAIKAVVKVESPKGAFNPDGTLTTLFEPHVFHRYTQGRFTASHPHLSSRKWNRALYGSTWQVEAVRLRQASALDPWAARMSTSWGMFQIMGFNHAACGYKDAADMVNDFATGEPAQLRAFVTLIEAWDLDDELRTGRWREFALAYNGPRAEENRYPQKIAAAFASFGGTIPPNVA